VCAVLREGKGRRRRRRGEGVEGGEECNASCPEARSPADMLYFHHSPLEGGGEGVGLGMLFECQQRQWVGFLVTVSQIRLLGSCTSNV